MNKTQTTEDLFILIGQSNADGRAPLAGLPGYLDSFFDTPRPHLKIFHKPAVRDTASGAFIDDGAWWSVGKGHDPARQTTGQVIGGFNAPIFGCELEYAYRHEQEKPGRPLRIIKAAVGGSSIDNPANAMGNWGIKAPDDDGLWVWFRDYIYKPAMAAMAAENVRPGAVRVFWMQGESDANDRDAPLYAARLQILIERLNAELAAKPDLIVIGGLSAAFNTGAGLIVKRAQQDVAAAHPNTVYVSTDGASLLPDNLHYDAAGMCAIGRDVYKATRPGP